MQRGLSRRVVRAVSERLERILAMASDDAGTRPRSRSPMRTAETTDLDASVPAQADGGLPEGTVPGGSLPEGVVPGGDLPEGTMPGETGDMPGPPNVPEMMQVLQVANQLAQNIATCGGAIQGVTADLEAACEVFTRGSETVKTGLSEVANQIGKQTSAVTTMSGGLMYETTEISKLLKAFDRFSNQSGWFMKGKQTLEANIHDVRMEIGALNSKLDATIGRGFEGTGKLIKDLIKVNEKIVTLLESQSGGAPIGTGMVAPASTAAVPPFPLPTPPPVPVNTGSTSGMAGSPPAPPATLGAGTATGTATGQPLPTSLFLAYCPETPGGQRPATAAGGVTPCQRVGILTKDAGTHQQRTLSPTGYRSNEISHLTAMWAPNGLASIRDGQQLVRRIY